MLRMDGGALAAAGTTAQTGKAASARTTSRRGIIAWISMAHGMHVRHVRVMVASLMTLRHAYTSCSAQSACSRIKGCALDVRYLMTLKASDRIYIYRERLCIR